MRRIWFLPQPNMLCHTRFFPLNHFRHGCPRFLKFDLQESASFALVLVSTFAQDVIHAVYSHEGPTLESRLQRVVVLLKTTLWICLATPEKTKQKNFSLHTPEKVWRMDWLKCGNEISRSNIFYNNNDSSQNDRINWGMVPVGKKYNKTYCNQNVDFDVS